MNVSVTPELELFVKGLVESGRYRSSSEVFRDGLRLLELVERRRLLEKAILEGLTPEEEARVPAELLEQARSQVRAKIDEGLESLDRGEKIGGEEFFARWRRRIDAESTRLEQSTAKLGL